MDRAAAIAYVLTSNYNEREELRSNYTLKKFTRYAVRETNQQGYSSLKTFIQELSDYLRMCKMQGIKPTVETDQLKKTHQVCSRNHKIFLDENQEKAFKNAYTYYKDEKINDKYTMVVPKCSEDLKHEGDNLNHCVASYIKRVMDGECLIFFLRKDVKESLVTIEVRNNKVAQVHGASNRAPIQEESEAIYTWAHKHGYKY